MEEEYLKAFEEAEDGPEEKRLKENFIKVIGKKETTRKPEECELLGNFMKKFKYF